MAATELATAYLSLVPSLKGSQGAIAKELGGVDGDGVGKAIGGKMGGGILGTLKGAIAPVAGIMAAVGIGSYLADAYQGVAAIEQINAQTAATIKSTGGAANVTAADVEALALSLEGMTATEAESIQEGANLLLTFTNIQNRAGAGNDIFNQATGIMVDYARAMGTDAAGASIQLGKALNDPTKGVTALAKAGVGFTDQQKEQIETLQASGDILGAQKIILAELEKQFGGSGAAYAATTAGKIDLLKDAYGDLGQTVVSAFLPAIGDAAGAGTVLLNSLQPVAESIGASAASAVSYLVGLGPTIGDAIGGVREIIANGSVSDAFARAFNVTEDAPIVGKLLATRQQIIDGYQGTKSILVDGDFTGAFSRAFNVQEDSQVVDVLFTIREGVVAAMDGVKGALGGIDLGGIFTSLGAAIAPLLPTILSLVTNLSPLSLVFQVLAPLLPQIAAVFVQLATVIGGTILTAITGLLPVAAQLQGVLIQLLSGVLVAVLPVVVQLITMLGATFAQLLPVLLPIITTIAGLAVTLISQLVPIIMQLVAGVLPPLVSIFGSVLGAIVPLVTMIGSLLIPIIQALMPVVVTVFGVVVSIITSAMQIVQGIIQVVTGIISGNWSQVWAGLGNIISGFGSLITNVITGAMSIVRSVITAGVNIISTLWSAGWSAIGSVLSGAWNGIRNVASSGVQAVQSVVSNVFNAVVGFISGIPGRFLSAISGVAQLAGTVGGYVSAMRDVVSGKFGEVVSLVSGVPGRVLSGLGNLGGYLAQAGRDLINGFMGGIRDMAGSVVQAAQDVVGGAVNGAKALLGIKSPSRVMRYEVGQQAGQGFILGIRDKVAEAQTELEALVAAPDPAAFTSGLTAAAYTAPAPARTGEGGDGVRIDVHPSERMDERDLAEQVARKLEGAGIG